jgi:XTP/dITP diphosphohydrolase
MPARLVVATANRGKLAEFRRLLGDRAELLSLDDAGHHGELPEPGITYTENARAKAEAVRDATGLPAIADDSGIEVPGLDDFPGPLSARWMGEGVSDRDRLAGLLRRVAEECPGDRRARYVAAVALATPGMPTVVTTGTCSGVLVDPPRGERGFGYDPSFFSDDLGGHTFGEADDAVKDTVSHRARALRLLLQTGALDAISGDPRAS